MVSKSRKSGLIRGHNLGLPAQNNDIVAHNWIPGQWVADFVENCKGWKLLGLADAEDVRCKLVLLRLAQRIPTVAEGKG